LLAPKGQVLVVTDSGAIEARKLAWFSDHTELVLAFAQNRDVYSEFASVAYGRPVDRKKNPEDEVPGFVGKTCTLGLGYQLGPAKLAQTFLAGAMGGPPVQFTLKEATALRVDIAEIAADPYHVKRVKQIPTRLSFHDMMIHYAVCKALVDRYRETNVPIVESWKNAEIAIGAMFTGEEFRFGPNLQFVTAKETLILPSGRRLRYPELAPSGRRGWSYRGQRGTGEKYYSRGCPRRGGRATRLDAG
jgi:hypothetical protein